MTGRLRRRRGRRLGGGSRRGCGRKLSSLIRPIHGSQAAHDKYAGICGSCMTEDEKIEMQRMQLEAIIKNASGLRIA